MQFPDALYLSFTQWALKAAVCSFTQLFSLASQIVALCPQNTLKENMKKNFWRLISVAVDLRCKAKVFTQEQTDEGSCRLTNKDVI